MLTSVVLPSPLFLKERVMQVLKERDCFSADGRQKERKPAVRNKDTGEDASCEPEDEEEDYRSSDAC